VPYVEEAQKAGASDGKGTPLGDELKGKTMGHRREVMATYLFFCRRRRRHWRCTIPDRRAVANRAHVFRAM
ncbi:MAG: hypothetical protein ACYCOU_08485, partial [Sulfobacillus sp.]